MTFFSRTTLVALFVFFIAPKALTFGDDMAKDKERFQLPINSPPGPVRYVVVTPPQPMPQEDRPEALLAIAQDREKTYEERQKAMDKLMKSGETRQVKSSGPVSKAMCAVALDLAQNPNTPEASLPQLLSHFAIYGTKDEKKELYSVFATHMEDASSPKDLRAACAEIILTNALKKGAPKEQVPAAGDLLLECMKDPETSYDNLFTWAPILLQRGTSQQKEEAHSLMGDIAYNDKESLEHRMNAVNTITHYGLLSQKKDICPLLIHLTPPL